MNNENAIRVLEEFKVIDDWTIVHLPDMEDAVDVAIEALKNEINCVKCRHYTERETYTGIKGVCKMDTAHRGDTISRQALMKRISEEYHKYGDDYDALQILGDIEDFPSAPDSRQRGEWVDEYGNRVGISKDGIVKGSCWCDQCGIWNVASDEYAVMGNFCPSCGADMRGEDE